MTSYDTIWLEDTRCLGLNYIISSLKPPLFPMDPVHKYQVLRAFRIAVFPRTQDAILRPRVLAVKAHFT